MHLLESTDGFEFNSGLGLKATIETIDNRADFKTYMQNYAFARGSAPPRGPRREGPSEEGFVSSSLFVFIPKANHTFRFQLPPLPTLSEKMHPPPQTPASALTNGHGHNGIQDKGRPTFGVDLAEQMTRDNVEVPPIMVKCCEAIEKHGIQSQGIYRVSGMTSKVANLRQRLEKGTS